MPKNKRIHRNDSYIAAFGARLRVLRKELGYSQEALANKCDLWLSTIGRVERGEIDPTISTVKKIADGLDIDVVELFKI